MWPEIVEDGPEGDKAVAYTGPWKIRTYDFGIIRCMLKKGLFPGNYCKFYCNFGSD